MTDRTERAPSAFRLNLEQQKNRAKDLLHAVKAGDAEALSRFIAVRRSSVTPDSPTLHATVKLADAQFVIARELRFPSWAKLKAHIESMDRERAAIDQKKPAPDADLKTLHIRCGHDLQNAIKEAGFVGDFWPYVTPYCVGPVRPGPEGRELMARFIVESFFEEKGDDVVSGTPALPIMAPALLRLLRELPAVQNGLRLTEQLILQLVSEGPAEGLRVWGDVWWRLKDRDPLPWVTGGLFLQIVKEMLAGTGPLLNFTRIPPLPEQTTVLFPNQLKGDCAQLLSLTELGRAVLQGERDWHPLRHASYWVGGVHVQPGLPGWRWDESKRDPVFREA